MQVFERPTGGPPPYPHLGPGGPGSLPPAPSALPGRTRAVLALVLGLAVSVAAVAGASLVGALAGASDGHPAAWDARVANLAAYVERARGLDFEHPVEVDFLTPARYREATTTEESLLSTEERRDLESWAAQTRALGLASGKLDLGAAYNSLSGDGTLAFYDPLTERIQVRGTEMTVGLEVTLAHELTHALQDQHFDIDRQFDTDGAGTAFRALVEGDAVRIKNTYVEDLSEADLQAYLAEADAEAREATDDLGQVPEALQVLFSAPYPLGERFVDLVLGSGGENALDELFADPPESELALLDPGSWLSGEKPRKVDEPALVRGERRVDSGDLGALTLYTMLASRMEPRTAAVAVDGWNGDAYIAFEKSGTTCVRLAVAGADRAAAGRLHDALGASASALTPASPAVSLDGSVVEVLTCDPGTKADRGPAEGRMHTSLWLPIVRSEVVAGYLGLGSTEREAACMGLGVVEAFSAGELAGPEGEATAGPGFEQRMQAIEQDCGLSPSMTAGTAA